MRGSMTGPVGEADGKQRHTYVEFRDLVARALADEPGGLTWGELRARMGWERERPCYAWAEQLEDDIGLRRVRRGNRVHWTINPPHR